MSDRDSSFRTPQSALRNLVLAGPMGAGKSTVARRVAERLARPLLDMDAELERRLGQPIAAVFATAGEAAFRRAEAALCAELTTPQGLVVAAGGGAVIDPANRAALATGGMLVCLMAPPAVLLARLGSEADMQARPLLRGPDPAGALAALLVTRAPAYAALPYQIDTTGRTPDEVAAAVLALYESVCLDCHPSLRSGSAD